MFSLFLPTVSALAQTQSACAMGYTKSLGPFFLGSSRQALTATVKNTFEQTLADGNRITLSATTRMAQQSSGINVTEHTVGCRLNDKGVPTPLIRTDLVNPATKTEVMWWTGDIRTPLNNLRQTDVMPEHQPITPDAQQAALNHFEMQRRKAETVEIELGSKVIAGTEANGHRSTRTIPAGESGNTLPIVIVTETWRAPGIDVPLLSISDDPRVGRLTMEVTSLTLGEPDAALFEAPGRPVNDELRTSATRLTVNPPAATQ